jgi:hypothetical protein
MTDQNTSKTRSLLIFGVAGALVLLLGVAAVLLTGSEDPGIVSDGVSGEDATAVASISETRPVTVVGSGLVPMPEQGTDTALGLPMPELTGQSFDGTPVEIKNDGRPKIIIFLTHW